MNIAVGAQEYDGTVAAGRHETLLQLQSVDLRHRKIEKQTTRRLRLVGHQEVPRGVEFAHFVSRAAHEPSDGAADVRIIIHNENSPLL